MEYGSKPEHQESILEFLNQIELFSNIPNNILKEIVESLSYILIRGGETLIYEYDSADCLYIVKNGRLRIFKEENGKTIELGEVEKGNVVGETALLVDVPRTASVIAVRDSVLLKITRNDFSRLLENNPLSMMPLIQNCIKSLLKKDEFHREQIGQKNIALLPSEPLNLFEDFVSKLHAELNQLSPTLHLTSKKIDELLGANTAQTPFESDRNFEILDKLYELENKYKYIIYQADPELSAWTLRCIRQADRIVLANAVADKMNIPPQWKKEINFSKAKIDLVLLHENKKNKPTNTKYFLTAINPDSCHHIDRNSIDDIKRLIRFLTGNAVGLVLSGAGARGLAYIGVFKAFEELKIPIDFIGGTSMGACMAAIYASGGDYKKFMIEAKQLYENYMKHRDYSIPIVSLLQGKYLSGALQFLFDDTQIEDLWTPFFCVSSDLTTYQLHLHEKGNLRQSIWASTAIPGIYPPFINENQHMLVDGGLINNLPVDIMRTKINGGKIYAAEVLFGSYKKKYGYTENYLPGYRLLLEKLFLKKQDTPNIIEIILSSMMMGGTNYQEVMCNMADKRIVLDMKEYSILDFKPYEELMEKGYQQTIQQLTDQQK